jgi:thiol-disulfide isomerase/thioredoxin
VREPIGVVRARGRGRRWLIDAAVIAAAFFLVHAFMVRGVVRGPLPPLSGALADGTPLAVQQWQRDHGGGPFLLYVWASWCPICKAVESNVEAVAADWPLLTVAMQSGNGAEVGRFLEQRGYRWPTLVDADARLARELGVDAVPTLIFVGRDGEVSAVTRGYTSEAGIRLRLWWAQRF